MPSSKTGRTAPAYSKRIGSFAYSKFEQGSRGDGRPKSRETSVSTIDNEEAVRLIPVGGLEEIGRNMSIVEYRDEIIVIDAGIQFPEDTTPGIDFIIPNVEYLAQKKDKIRALVLTHAHFDHIGAIPYIIEKIGNPLIYATVLTKAFVERRHTEFPNLPKLRFQVIDEGDRVKIGKYFELEFFGVPHTVPETTGVVVKTPVGNIVHFADFRIEYDEHDKPQGLEEFRRIGNLGVHTLMMDSTNADEEGHSLSEKVVEKSLKKLFEQAKGRIILATFASMLTRINEIIKIAEKLGRRVAINGRSMKEGVQISLDLGYIKTKKDSLIQVEEIHKYPDDKVVIITTGAQGQENAGLMRIATGEHRHIQLKPSDMVIFSSSVIPGNERSVQNLHDLIARQVNEVYNSKLIDIHASGHAPKEDLELVANLIKPKFLLPIHAHFFKRAANGKNGVAGGVKAENVRLMDNGQVALLTKDQFVVTKETIPAYYVMVDGLGVGDVGEVVIRDRRILAEEGMLVIIVTLDKQSGQILKNPDIISRGFIYLKENQEMLGEIRRKIRSLVGKMKTTEAADGEYIKGLIRDDIGQFLYNKIKRRPMVLPVIIEI